MKSKVFNSFGLTVAWLTTTIFVFFVLDTYATRDYPVYVEDYRRMGMTDEETVAAAVQDAHQCENNAWWIHDKKPHLVFEAERSYDLDPIIFTTFDIEITTQENDGMVGFFRPIPAISTP